MKFSILNLFVICVFASALLGAHGATAQLGSCGDGFLQSDFEQCDDGNLIDGDGCESDCRWELTPTTNNCADPTNCEFDGFLNIAMGSAQLALSGGALVVSNIGSSGLDGVSQTMPCTTDMLTILGTPNFSLSSTGAVLLTEQLGLVDGLPNTVFSTFRIENVGPGLEMETDFSFVGTTSYRIDLFLGRSLITSEIGLSSGLMTLPVVDVEALDCRIDEDGNIVTTGESGPVTITIPGRGAFVADNWRISTGNLTKDVKFQSAINMLAADTGDLTLVNEFSFPSPATPDCNNDGIPDSDINNNGIPDECEAGGVIIVSTPASSAGGMFLLGLFLVVATTFVMLRKLGSPVVSPK